MLVPARVALDTLASDKKLSTKVSRPVRDVLLYGSSALFSVAAIGTGIASSISSVVLDEMKGSTGMVALFFVIGLFAFTAALTIILACAWAVLALPILLVSWLWNRGNAPVLRVAPFAHEAGVGHEPPRGKWQDSFTAWFAARKKRVILAMIGAIGFIEIAGELMDDNPIFFQPPAQMLKVVALAAVCQLIGLAFLMVPVTFAIQWLLWSFDHLRRVRHLLREKKIESLATDPEAHLPSFESERGHAEGRLVRGDAAPLVAPLSGEECLGFRVEGRVGQSLLDDSFVCKELSVQLDDARVGIRATRLVLVVPPSSERTRDLTPEQRERVEALLARLGLPMSDNLELGESLLREGNRVNAHGAESSEPAQGDGYRSATQRMLLTDSDGLPVLVLK